MRRVCNDIKKTYRNIPFVTVSTNVYTYSCFEIEIQSINYEEEETRMKEI